MALCQAFFHPVYRRNPPLAYYTPHRSYQGVPMKSLILFCSLIVATLVYAELPTPQKMNKYEATYLDCVDYGHSDISEEKKFSCHEKAKSEVLSTFKSYQDYLDCIDYGHGTVTVDEEKVCLKQIKSSNEIKN